MWRPDPFGFPFGFWFDFGFFQAIGTPPGEKGQGEVSFLRKARTQDESGC